MAVKQNIIIEQGADYDEEITITYANGDIVDLTGRTFASQARKHSSSLSAITLNVASAIPSSGKIQQTLNAANTAALTPGRYRWDVEATLTANGHVLRAKEGMLTITPEMTKV